MIAYKWLIIGAFLLVLFGCGGRSIRHVPTVANERISITTSYDADVMARQSGDRFAFSFIIPNNVNWTYTELDPGLFLGGFESTKNKGYIVFFGVNEYFNRLVLEWRWRSVGAIEHEWVDEPDWIMIPWYKDITPDIGTRIYYTPRESELRYGDWYRLGYPQTLFKDIVRKGPQDFYCVRVVFNRSGSADWDSESGTMTIKNQDTAVNVHYECPFRTIDGLNALFKIETGFQVTEQELLASHQIIDDRLDALDLWLEPLWETLVIDSRAYQFDAPNNAKQSIFCETNGYCW